MVFRVTLEQADQWWLVHRHFLPRAQSQAQAEAPHCRKNGVRIMTFGIPLI